MTYGAVLCFSAPELTRRRDKISNQGKAALVCRNARLCKDRDCDLWHYGFILSSELNLAYRLSYFTTLWLCGHYDSCTETFTIHYCRNLCLNKTNLCETLINEQSFVILSFVIIVIGCTDGRFLSQLSDDVNISEWRWLGFSWHHFNILKLDQV